MVFKILFLLIISTGRLNGECPCEGIVIDASDQSHCWQLESRDYTTWTSADDACQSVGGHLGHPDQSDFDTVWDYVKENTALPVITGIVAGNVEIPIYAKMCPDNVFYSTITNTTNLFANTATSNETCSFMTNTSSELVFMSCSTDAKVLCDRPLEENDYCSIMANCTTSTTYLSTTTEATTSISISSSSSSSSSTLTSILSSTASTTAATNSSSSSSSSSSTTSSGAVASDDSSGTTPTSTQTTTISASAAAAATTTSSSTACLKHQFKLFGMCIDWRALLAMILIGLLIFLCCCICHFCLRACMWCSPTKREKEVRDPILPVRSTIAPMKMAYDEKPDVILPPPAVLPEPVIVTVPEKHESVYGFHTKEIIHLLPDKPDTREIGIMTDPVLEVVPDVVVVAPAPIEKRKKVVKKPKKMFIPSTIDPIDEEMAEDIPIPDVRTDSPGGNSIAPLGDEPAIVPPLMFTKNPKPLGPEGVPGDDNPMIPTEKDTIPPFEQEPNSSPKPRSNNDPDPRGIRSPPIMANNKPMSFSPIPDDSDDEPPAMMNKIPSPPSKKKPINPKSSPVPLDEDSSPFSAQPPEMAPPPLRNKRLNEPSDTAPSPNSGSNDRLKPSNNPFANIGGDPANNSNNGDNAEPRGRPQSDVGIKAARGKLGGVVKGGGGGGDAPAGWKPWAKGNKK